MSITGIVTGIWMSVSGAGDGDISAGDVLYGAKMIYAIQTKTEQGTWDDSTELENVLHELNHSIAELEKQMREAEAEQLPKMYAGMEGTL